MTSAEKPAGGRERRAHPRAACDGSITLRLEDGSYRARLRDVSRSGICFYLDRPLAEMTLLSLRIELPSRARAGAGAIEGSGVVVRCLPLAPALDHYEIALFFHALAEEQRARLDEFVAAAV